MDTQVTRAADQISLATSAFPYNAAAETLLAEYTLLNASGAHDGTNNKRVDLYDSVTSPFGYVASGAVASANIDLGVQSPDSTQGGVSCGRKWCSGGARWRPLGPDTAATELAGITMLGIGQSGAGTAPLNG